MMKTDSCQTKVVAEIVIKMDDQEVVFKIDDPLLEKISLTKRTYMSNICKYLQHICDSTAIICSRFSHICEISVGNLQIFCRYVKFS